MTEIATVDFHGDRLFVFEQEGGQFVAMKPIVEALGLDWHGQRQRIHRDEVLTAGAVVMPSPSAGGTQDTLCLPLHLLNGWLFGVDVSRVKEELREKITLYRSECFQALADYFGVGTELTESRPVPDYANLMTMQERRQLVNEARVTFCRQSARELWEKMGLPMTPTMSGYVQGPSAEDLKDKILLAIRAWPGAPQREIIKKFQQHGYMRVKSILSTLEQDGLINQMVRRPPRGGRPATFVSAAPTLN